MKDRSKLITAGLLALAVAVCSSAPVALAQCDIPLISQQTTIAPNVMIVMDSSGSMNTIMEHEDYDPGVSWSGKFNNSVYSVGADSLFTPSSFNATWEASPAARLVPGLHGQTSRYEGRYLNWLFYHATDAQRASAPVVTRQMVMNAAVKYVMDAAGGLRFGLTRFNGGNGGTVVAPCGAPQADLESAVDVMVADGTTPLAETLWTVLEYYRGNNSTYSSPIDYDCQMNFVVMLTDGLPYSDNDIPNVVSDGNGNGLLDELARYAATTDVDGSRPGEQFVEVNTVGFGINDPLLENTAENGNGIFRVAWDLDTLVYELGTVLGDIISRISSGASVAVVSTETGDDTYLYRGKFMPGAWRGYLEAYSLPYSDGQSPVWEAGEVLRSRSASSRVIFTSVNNTMVEFSPDEVATLGPLIAPDGPGTGDDPNDAYGSNGDNVYDANDSAVGPNYDEDYAREVIEYVRGEQVDGFRDREGWLLGDLVYSTPVVVGPPAEFYLDEGYQDFLVAYENRQPIVYAGANDGMLHAFNADTGAELWGYVPREVLGTLEDLTDTAYCHTSYVDLSPTAIDAKINGTWRTVLIGGLRTGGDSYFAIDVTDPYAPNLLWETKIPSLVNSFTDPVVVHTTRGSFVWTGSGPNPLGTAYAGVISLDDGTIHWNLPLSSGYSSKNAATAPAPIDVDFDGYHDRVYQADLMGNVWVFDVSDASSWYFGKLYSGSDPIQATPSLSLAENGDVNVYFGTGVYMNTSDVTDVSSQSFNCVRDDFSWTEVSSGSLTNVASLAADATLSRGWSLPLENGAGERVTESAIVVEGVVYFTSFKPSTAPCSAGGYSYLYSVDYETAAPIDRDEDGNLSEESRSSSTGVGVASRPVVNLSSGELIVQTSDARLTVADLLLSPQRILVRSWQQSYGSASTANQE